MTRATIKDIAAQSGLSTSTVDRTLNGRAGVSALNRYSVMQAAQRLGYPALLGTMPMPSRPVRIAILAPHLDRAFITLVAETIRRRPKKTRWCHSAELSPSEACHQKICNTP